MEPGRQPTQVPASTADRAAAAIEAALAARLRAAGEQPLPQGGEAERDRLRRFASAVEGAIGRREERRP